MPTLPLSLDRGDPRPLPVQLADGVRALVLAGTLEHGDRLPSTRALARDLGVGRAVAEQAYDQLLAEGWATARRGAGTFVAGSRAAASRHERATPRATRPASPEPDHARGQDHETLQLLDSGTPWIDPRHDAGWRRAWREVAAARPPRGYPDPRGLPELRARLADRLARQRGLEVDPDDVLVTGGTTDGLRQVVAALGPGDVAVEDPGYRAAVETARAAGRRVRDVPALAPVVDLAGCAAAYVTPAHQHPLGRVMPAADRVGLLAAARAAGTVVIEDDYDSEFRYDVAPVPALAALDRERVAYLGTAAKSVAPSLRLGWLVAPRDLHAALCARRDVTQETAPWPVQRAFAAMLRAGHVDRVVRSARRVYAERAPRVASALAPFARQAGPPAGMYSTWLLPQADAVRAQAAARRAGFEVDLLADFCRTAGLTGLVVGFGGVDDAGLDRALAALTSALR